MFATSAPSKFTKEYISADQAITSGGLLTLAHGFGVVPKEISLKAKCATAENNWAIGEQQFIGRGGNDQYSGSQPSSPVVWADATNIYVRYNVFATQSMSGLDKTTGGYAAMNNAKWLLIVRAWA